MPSASSNRAAVLTQPRRSCSRRFGPSGSSAASSTACACPVSRNLAGRLFSGSFLKELIDGTPCCYLY